MTRGVGDDDEVRPARPDPGATVLVVDDEPDLRLLLRVVLEREGYRVVGEAEDGIEAIEQFDALAPDAVVVDLAMPNLGGVEVAKRIRTRSSAVIVAYSAAPTREDERELLRLGVPLVVKDASAGALVRVLDSVINAA